MAKQSAKTLESIISDIEKREFSPIYILMGEEPYYADIITNKLIDTVLTPQEKEFNQTIIYGTDTNAAEVVQLCRKFPMFSDKQLVVVKEAQALSKTDAFEIYFKQPSPETILVLAYNGKGMDKRSKAYTKAKENACILESNPIKEWEVNRWITDYFKKNGYSINPQAALLMAEHTGNSLRKINIECSKLITGLSNNRKDISLKDIEDNIGISKEYSAFELCNKLFKRDLTKSFKIAYYLGENSRKYPLTLTLGAMFYYFSKLLRCHSYWYKDKGMPENATKKAGIYDSQIQDYVMAMKNYPLKKNINIISLIREYDYKSKSNSGGNASEGELLIELITKILK